MSNQPEDDDFYEDPFVEFDQIKFSPEVQNAIEQVNGVIYSMDVVYLGC